ncbi:MAG: magnesium transporter CorA family protein, partial [Gemmataceae bacterium]|nr:magnesium transporter CorA family protein [Gemmataceae bacterium]
HMVDQYAPTVDKILEELDEIESTIFQEPSSGTLNRLLLLKRRIVHLRKTLIMEREVLARLIRGEFELVDDREVAYYRNVYDHLVRYAELLETSREMVSDLMQTQLAAVSNRLNGVMKGLATISTIILPMTLITGIYGMNFEFMPELKWVIGYPFALSLMVLAAAVSLYFFRRQKWI